MAGRRRILHVHAILYCMAASTRASLSLSQRLCLCVSVCLFCSALSAQLPAETRFSPFPLPLSSIQAALVLSLRSEIPSHSDFLWGSCAERWRFRLTAVLGALTAIGAALAPFLAHEAAAESGQTVEIDVLAMHPINQEESPRLRDSGTVARVAEKNSRCWSRVS